MKNMLIGLFIVLIYSCIIILASTAGYAMAKNPRPVPYLDETQKIALAYLERLENIPEQGGKTEAQETMLKERVTKILVHEFAGYIKTGRIEETGNKKKIIVEAVLTKEDIKKALNIFFSSEVFISFADYSANKDGFYTADELNQLSKKLKTNPGLKFLWQMYTNSLQSNR